MAPLFDLNTGKPVPEYIPQNSFGYILIDYFKALSSNNFNLIPSGKFSLRVYPKKSHEIVDFLFTSNSQVNSHKFNYKLVSQETQGDILSLQCRQTLDSFLVKGYAQADIDSFCRVKAFQNKNKHDYEVIMQTSSFARSHYCINEGLLLLPNRYYVSIGGSYFNPSQKVSLNLFFPIQQRLTIKQIGGQIEYQYFDPLQNFKVGYKRLIEGNYLYSIYRQIHGYTNIILKGVYSDNYDRIKLLISKPFDGNKNTVTIGCSVEAPHNNYSSTLSYSLLLHCMMSGKKNERYNMSAKINNEKGIALRLGVNYGKAFSYVQKKESEWFGQVSYFDHIIFSFGYHYSFKHFDKDINNF
ncbi:hypothetical protein WA158_004156 [Blastocystis sp. Blastoise]